MKAETVGEIIALIGPHCPKLVSEKVISMLIKEID